jgi:hypothetical protein
MPVSWGIESAHPRATQRLLKVAREVQDILFATRKQAVRVPQWFYGRFRDADEQDRQANATQLRSKLVHRQPGGDGPWSRRPSA